MKLTLLHQGLFVVAIPLIFEVGVFSYLINAQNNLELEAQKINQNKKINDKVNLVFGDVAHIVDSVRAKGHKSSTISFVPKEAVRCIADIRQQFKELKVLTQDEPEMLASVESGEEEVNRAISSVTSIRTRLVTANSDEFPKIVREATLGVEIHIQKAIEMGVFEWAGKNKIAQEMFRKEIWEQIRFVLKGALAFSLVLGVSFSIWLSKQLVQRLSLLNKNALLMANDKPLLPVQGGSDEIAELERNFHQAAERLQEAKRTRQEVTAMITHDLRTPLQTVLSFLEMSGQGIFGALNASGQRLMNVALNAANHMSSLIENVLQLEKLRSGAVKLNKETIDVGAFLSNCIDSVKLIADEKGISINLDTSGLQTQTLIADPFWLEQVIVNVLSNAIKFSPNDSSVSVVASTDLQSFVFRISDHGPGIPPEELKLIFDRFHRMQSTASTPGTGLGLPIAKEMIELHGGKIRVESTVGKGAMFEIMLPCGGNASEYSSKAIELPQNSLEQTSLAQTSLAQTSTKQTSYESAPKEEIGHSSPRRKFRLTLLHKTLILLCIPLCLEIGLFGWLLSMQNKVEQDAERIEHNSQVNDTVNIILRDMVHIAIGLRKRQRKEEQDQVPASKFRVWFSDIQVRLKRLETLVENEDLVNRVKSAEYTIAALEHFSVNRREDFSPDKDKYRDEVSTKLFESMSYINKRSSSAKYDLSSNELQYRAEIRRVLYFALCLSILVACRGAMWFSRNIVIRLKRLGDNAKRLVSGQPLLAPVEGADEVAELDATFHSAAAQIEAAKRMRQEATAMITHDLKTPLQSVRSFLEMLANGKFGEVNERGVKLLSASQRSSQHMLDLINSVLELEKLRSGHLQLQTEPLELSSLLDKCLESIKVLADGKQIALTSDYGEFKSALVEGDAFWLEQVFVNVLSNAIKFSPGNSTVSLRIEKIDNSLEVLITDQGVGIPAEDLKLIFERFHRAQSSALTPGTGLGLPIAKELIELHHGSIKAESDLGKGSTFSIRLPLADSPGVEETSKP